MGFKRENMIALKPTGLTLDEVRAKLSGLHFSKGMLSKGECEILALAESLLTALDKGN